MWIDFYNKIFALDDVKRPPQAVLEDDEQFDAWLKRQQDENRRDLVDFYRAQDELKRNRKNGSATRNTWGNTTASRRHG